MAIQVTIVDAGIQNNELYLTVDTTNDAAPGDKRRFSGKFAQGLTALQIKTQIDTAVSLLWVALGTRSWTV